MSHYPHFPSFEYNFCEGLVELNRQLELAQSEKQSVTERDLLSLEGVDCEFLDGEPLLYISLDGTGEPLSSALHRCSDELGFAIDSCVSICSIRGSELVKAFNLFLFLRRLAALQKERCTLPAHKPDLWSRF